MRMLGWLGLGWMALASAVAAAPPRVSLELPKSGFSTERIMTIRGSVSDAAIQRATLVFNGTERTIGLHGGRFEYKVVLSRGQNSILVYATNGAGEQGSAAASFYSRVPYKDMSVVLTWDTDGTDVDLWVEDPKGERCGYSNPTTAIGGSLDIDMTQGYGPETFTLEDAMPGHYKVNVHYYSDNGNPQTAFQVTVILFEGTDKEARRVYEGMLTRTDSDTEVADVEIQPETFAVEFR